jgi:biotin-(acetyl-CoA carboxylase) ligase
MGLNINQAVFELPLNKATSLFLENGVKYKLDNELTDVLTYIEHRYLQWKNGHYSQLKKQYIEVLYLYQHQHRFTLPNGNLLKGKIVGVADNGQLLIEDDAGFILHFGNKEIAF